MSKLFEIAALAYFVGMIAVVLAASAIMVLQLAGVLSVVPGVCG